MDALVELFRERHCLAEQVIALKAELAALKEQAPPPFPGGAILLGQRPRRRVEVVQVPLSRPLTLHLEDAGIDGYLACERVPFESFAKEFRTPSGARIAWFDWRPLRTEARGER